METIFDYIIIGVIVVGAVLYVLFNLYLILYWESPTKKELDKEMNKNDKNV